MIIQAFEIISNPSAFQIAQVWTRNSPFDKNNKSLKKLQKKRKVRMSEFERNIKNLLYATKSKDWLNHLLSTSKSKDWLNHDVMFHMKVNLRRKTQSLCSNKVKNLFGLDKSAITFTLLFRSFQPKRIPKPFPILPSCIFLNIHRNPRQKYFFKYYD